MLQNMINTGKHRKHLKYGTPKKYFKVGQNSVTIDMKGTVKQDFRPFSFGLKDSSWALYEQAQMVLWNFSFSQRFSRKFAKNVFPRSRWLCWHSVSLSAWSLTTPTQYRRRLRQHSKLFILLWKKKKLRTKSNKKCPLKFSTNACPCICWLRGHMLK